MPLLVFSALKKITAILIHTKKLSSLLSFVGESNYYCLKHPGLQILYANSLLTQMF